MTQWMPILLDVLLMIAVFVVVLQAARKGFVAAMVDLVGYIASLIGAWILGKLLAQWIFDAVLRPTLLKWADIYRKMQSEGVPFSLKELKIGGNDLADILPPQKRGKVLAALLAECAYDGRKNDKNYLMAQAARLAAKEE